MGDLNRRKGIIMDSSTNGDDCIIQAEVPLNAMFGYSSVLRWQRERKREVLPCFLLSEFLEF
jgi:elongation factor G